MATATVSIPILDSSDNISSYSQLTLNTASAQTSAALVNGSTVYAWSTSQYFVSQRVNFEIYGMVVDSGGVASQPFLIATPPTTRYGDHLYYSPNLAPLSNGGFVVAYADGASTGMNNGIFIRKFDNSGTPISGQMLVGKDPDGPSVIRVFPTVDVLTDTSFTVGWSGRNGAQSISVNESLFTLSSSNVSALNPICFTRGTHIQIGEQSKPVETLSISNQVSTTKASAAVTWIGYQRRTPEFAQFQDYLPVKISAGALDESLPLRDLYLSPDHAVLIDEHLIQAKALVNGKTIVQMTEWEGDIEYYHIETEAHEIIYAEGIPCETFIDNVSREQFDNYAEYQALYPNTRMMKELPLPRVKFKRQLPTIIKQRLESRIIELDRQKKG